MVHPQIVIIDQYGDIKSGKHKGKNLMHLTDTLFLFIVMTQSENIDDAFKATLRLEQLAFYQ